VASNASAPKEVTSNQQLHLDIQLPNRRIGEPHLTVASMPSRFTHISRPSFGAVVINLHSSIRCSNRWCAEMIEAFSLNPFPMTLGHQSSSDCRNAYKYNEELEDQGIAAIWFDVVNSRKQHGGNEASAQDVNDSRHFPSLQPRIHPQTF
jgi:hypothetical protein